MRPLSEREQLIWGSFDKEEALSLDSALGLESGNFSVKNFSDGSRVVSILSDRQLQMIEQNRLSFSPPLPPLICDVIEVTGARSGQIIDEVNGLIFPGDTFKATFNLWQSDGTLTETRSNRNQQAKYILEPRMTLVYPAK